MSEMFSVFDCMGFQCVTEENLQFLQNMYTGTYSI